MTRKKFYSITRAISEPTKFSGPLESGEYTVRLDKVGSPVYDRSNGRPAVDRSHLYWVFTTEGGVSIRVCTTRKLSPGSSASRVMEALGGDPHSSNRVEPLIGRRCVFDVGRIGWTAPKGEREYSNFLHGIAALDDTEPALHIEGSVTT